MLEQPAASRAGIGVESVLAPDGITVSLGQRAAIVPGPAARRQARPATGTPVQRRSWIEREYAFRLAGLRDHHSGLVLSQRRSQGLNEPIAGADRQGDAGGAMPSPPNQPAPGPGHADALAGDGPGQTSVRRAGPALDRPMARIIDDAT